MKLVVLGKAFVIPAEAGTQGFQDCALRVQLQCSGSPPPRG